MATPHISAAKGDFAKTVLMPGDPLRAKFIAETFLEDVKLVTSVRNALGYTGLYKGVPVSVMTSGMGMPSIGIYSMELYKFYGVENIIRIGSAGSYRDWLKVMDVTLAEVAVSESSYALVQGGCKDNAIKPSQELNDVIMAKAKEYGIAPNRIHIDPLVEMLCTSENGIETNVEVISTVREKYPTIHITAAVSNISFNLPVRKMVNLGFTVLAMNAGLDSAILDPTNRDMMGVIFATEALLGLDDYCMEYISAYREGLFGPVKQ